VNFYKNGINKNTMATFLEIKVARRFLLLKNKTINGLPINRKNYELTLRKPKSSAREWSYFEKFI
jgi:hypothetical protein